MSVARAGSRAEGRTSPGISRRHVLTVFLCSPVLVQLVGSRAAAATPTLVVHKRDEWAQGLQPRGPMSSERPGDVRFLLVHHSETSNDYSRDEVTSQIRSFYGYHTTTKGWPDIAYNFLVDAYGGVWEGREGSLAGPVRGDATGGSQGYAQLACYIGDHKTVPPTAAAQASMVRLLAHLSQRYGIATTPGATVSFVSRGSNRYPAGAHVTAQTISGHRDMSETTCPGDAAYGLLPSWRRRVREVVSATSTQQAPRPSVSATTAARTSTSPVSAPPSMPAAGSTAAAAPTTTPGPGRLATTGHSSTVARDGLIGGIVVMASAGVAGVAAVALRARSRGRG